MYEAEPIRSTLAKEEEEVFKVESEEGSIGVEQD